MSDVQDIKNMNAKLNALKSLILFILLFVVLKAVAIALYLFMPLFSVLAYAFGTLVLIVGIYLVSKNNQELMDGLKVSILFVFAILFDLISNFLIISTPPIISASATIEEIGALDASFGNNIFLISISLLIAGIFTVVASHFFDSWFSDQLNFDKKKNYFTYYGVLFLFGEVMTFIGYVVLRRAIKQILAGWTGDNGQSIAFSNGIILFGTIFLIIAFIIEIIAGLRIFLLINNKSSST